MLWKKVKRDIVPEIKKEQPKIGSTGSRLASLWADGLGGLATRSMQIIIVIVLLAAIIFGMHYLSLVVIPTVLAVIFASAFAPVMKWFRAHRVPDALATVIVLLLIALTFVGVVWLIVWAVQDQFELLSKRATEGFDEVVSWLKDLPFAPDPEHLSQWREQVTDFLTSSSFGSGAMAGVGAVTNFITGFVLLIVILFFFLKDGPEIWKFLIRPFEGEKRERAIRAGHVTVDTFGKYVRGTAIVAAVDAIGIGIGLWIFKVPLALPLSVLVFFLSFIPLVGSTLAGILAILVALVSNGPINALIIAAVVIGVNQLEGNFLQPVVMGRALKLHALVILVALSIGTLLGGILGAVLAVPLTAVAWGIVKVWDGPDKPAKWARPHN